MQKSYIASFQKADISFFLIFLFNLGYLIVVLSIQNFKAKIIRAYLINMYLFQVNINVTKDKLKIFLHLTIFQPI